MRLNYINMFWLIFQIARRGAKAKNFLHQLGAMKILLRVMSSIQGRYWIVTAFWNLVSGKMSCQIGWPTSLNMVFHLTPFCLGCRSPEKPAVWRCIIELIHHDKEHTKDFLSGDGMDVFVAVDFQDREEVNVTKYKHPKRWVQRLSERRNEVKICIITDFMETFRLDVPLNVCGKSLSLAPITLTSWEPMWSMSYWI